MSNLLRTFGCECRAGNLTNNVDTKKGKLDLLNMNCFETCYAQPVVHVADPGADAIEMSAMKRGGGGGGIVSMHILPPVQLLAKNTSLHLMRWPLEFEVPHSLI